MRIYLVGGAVRDELLGLPVRERDWVVVGATPEDMRRLGFIALDREFPVFAHPETGEEYALARIEHKIGRGHKGFRIEAGPQVTLEDDLRRRDLTVNAMARSEEGAIIDPFAGRRDLERRSLRHVSGAFVEDPLRVLRAARFAARLAPLGFRLEPETLELMHAMAASGELETLTHGRVWAETERALEAAAPARYFEALSACGALGAVLPELGDAWQGDSTASTRPRAVLERAAGRSQDVGVRFAALVAALGAALGTARAERLCQRLQPRADHRDLALLALAASPLPRAVRDRDADAALEWLERCDALRQPQRFSRLLDACRALDPAAQTVFDWLERCQEAVRSVDSAPLRARGLAGPALGRALREARVRAIAHTA